MIRSRTSFKGARAGGAANWWEAGPGGASGIVAAYQPKGAADLASSYINLANPGTNNAAPGVAPTWNATNGWMFNGSTQYLTTGAAPGTARNWSIIAQFSNLRTSGNNVIVGSVSNPTFGQLSVSGFLGADRCQYVHGNFAYVTPALLAGNLATVGNKGYRNGVDEGVTLASLGGDITELYIGARNRWDIGGPDQFAQCYVQAVAIYDNTLDAATVASVAAAMAAI